jgi:hypothetical protein
VAKNDRSYNNNNNNKSNARERNPDDSNVPRSNKATSPTSVKNTKNAKPMPRLPPSNDVVLSRNKNSNFHELTKMTAARIVDVLDQHQARRINVFTRRIDLSTNKKPLTDATRLIASVILLPKLLKPYYGGPMTKTTAHLLMMMVLQMSDKGGTLVSDRQPPTPVKERARETLNTPSRDTSEKKSARSAARTTNKPTPHAIPFCSMLF